MPDVDMTPDGGAPHLAQMSHRGYTSGRSFAVQMLWYFTQSVLFANPLLTSYGAKRWMLRAFGAEIAAGVLIKPRVRVKCPWHLRIGRDAWIGEGVWIDNFVSVSIGPNACLSQGAYLCTGNHDWRGPAMDLVVSPIVVEEGAWVGAFSRVAPGVTVAKRSVVTLGSVLLQDTEEGMVYGGHPAASLKDRGMQER